MSNVNEKTEMRLAKREDMLRRRDRIIETGESLFRESNLLSSQSLGAEDVATAYQFLKESANFAHPDVFPSWWEHVYASAALARELSNALTEKGVDADPVAAEIRGLFHDIGRLALPSAYHTNDLVTRSILKRLGVTDRIGRGMVDVDDILKKRTPFADLSAEQRIFNFADNLGKRTPDGDLFTMEDFMKYMDTETRRYPQPNQAFFDTEKYGLEHMREAEQYQREIMQQTYDWLKGLGISFEDVREGIVSFTPAIVYIVRHGKTDNNGRPYNLDEFSETPVGIMPEGHEQMRQVARAITRRRIKVGEVYSSDLYRAHLSVNGLVDELKKLGSVRDDISVVLKKELRDVRAPSVMQYQTMEDFFAETGGNVYTPNLVAAGNESLGDLQERYRDTIERIVSQREENGSLHAVVVGHGDAIRTLIAGYDEADKALDSNDYERLKESEYLNQGEAWEMIFDPKNDYITRRKIPDPYQIGRREN